MNPLYHLKPLVTGATLAGPLPVAYQRSSVVERSPDSGIVAGAIPVADTTRM